MSSGSGQGQMQNRLRRALERVRSWPSWLRVLAGVSLILFGLVGFLPLVGFWMIPLGLLILSIDSPWLRRWRRRIELWWARRRRCHPPN